MAHEKNGIVTVMFPSPRLKIIGISTNEIGYSTLRRMDDSAPGADDTRACERKNLEKALNVGNNCGSRETPCSSKSLNESLFDVDFDCMLWK